MQRIVPLKAWLSALLLTSGLGAQTAHLVLPLGGLVHHASTRSLRSVIGVPGSAYLGPALLTGVEFAATAPDGRSAITRLQGQSKLQRIGEDYQFTEYAGADLINDIDLAVWSRAGSVAVVYSSASRQLQRLQITDQTVTVEPAVDISFLAGDVTALATAAPLGPVVFAVRHARSSGLYLLFESGPMLATPLDDPGPVAVSPDGETVFVVDHGSQSIIEVRNCRTAPYVTRFADNVSDSVGIAISQSGHHLYSVSRHDQKVYLYDIASQGLVSELLLDAAPTLLQPLSASSFLLLNSPGNTRDPLLVLDDGDRPAVYFIPTADLDSL